MKAVVLHEYGGPEVLKLEEAPDPVVGPGQVLLRVAAASINPLDLARRSGMAKGFFPVQFPGILGADVSGTVLEVGSGVDNFVPGDQVFGMAFASYAEKCVVPASNLAKVPAGLPIIDAAALPLVVLTGGQLAAEAARITAGQTVLVAGAAGSVGRAAVYTAKSLGATVIAGILSRHLDQASDIGADQIVATDDPAALANLPQLDAVADAVGGKTGADLISKVKSGGIFATVLSPPPNAGEFPGVETLRMRAHPDPARLLTLAQAVIAGDLKIVISAKFPLSEAAAGHAAVQARTGGKVLLIADPSLQ